MIAAGKLRHRLSIQEPAKTRAGDGTVSESWLTLAVVWASVAPIRGRELIEAQRFESQVTHRVRMRYYAGLTAQHRLLFGTRVLNIESVLNKEERNVEMELMCREVA